jgi:transposase
MQKNATSLSAIAAQYNVHLVTLKKWLKAYPEIPLNSKVRILTPKIVRMIYEVLGSPE